MKNGSTKKKSYSRNDAIAVATAASVPPKMPTAEHREEVDRGGIGDPDDVFQDRDREGRTSQGDGGHDDRTAGGPRVQSACSFHEDDGSHERAGRAPAGRRFRPEAVYSRRMLRFC